MLKWNKWSSSFPWKSLHDFILSFFTVILGEEIDPNHETKEQTLVQMQWFKNTKWWISTFNNTKIFFYIFKQQAFTGTILSMEFFCLCIETIRVRELQISMLLQGHQSLDYHTVAYMYLNMLWSFNIEEKQHVLASFNAWLIFFDTTLQCWGRWLNLLVAALTIAYLFSFHF